MGNGDKNNNLITDKELQIILDIHKSLVNITSTLNTFKDTLDDLADMEQKHGADLQLLNERMKFLNDLYEKINPVVNDTQSKLNTLISQLDFKERMEILQNKFKNKGWSFKDIVSIFKNSKYVAVIVVAILLILIFIYGGSGLLEKHLELLGKFLTK